MLLFVSTFLNGLYFNKCVSKKLLGKCFKNTNCIDIIYLGK